LFLANHKNIVAYFHGNSNDYQKYTFNGPDNNIDLNVFRVDSPMKGNTSAGDPSKLSFTVVSIDPSALKMTVRGYLWNLNTWDPNAANAFTVPLTPRSR
jgi:hypothetical protein